MEYVEIARAESERGELVLRERRLEGARGSLELRANGIFVMDTLETSTELELAGVALDLVDDPRDVVIGGLGLGFTLQRVLADVRVERATVVEIEDSLVAWMRDGTVPHGPALLADERVKVVVADIAVAVAEAPPASYDLVLLDVDNGPGYLVHDSNAEVYGRDFLARCRDVLNADGVLVVWSAARSPELLSALEDVFGSAEERAYDVLLQDRPEEYFLYVGRRSTSGGPSA